MLLPYKKIFNPLIKSISNNQKINKINELYIDIVGSRLSGKNYAVEELCCFLMFSCKSIGIHCYRYMNKDVEELDGNMRDGFIRVGGGDLINKRKIGHYTYDDNYMKVQGIFTQKKEKIKSLGKNQPYKEYKIIFIDEFFEFENENDWLDIKQAIRNYKHLIIIRISNPWLEQHWWIGDKWNKINIKEAEHIKTGWTANLGENEWNIWNNWKINKFLPPSKVEEMYKLEKTHPQRARVESYGLPGVVSGSIYGKYLKNISGVLQPCSFFVGGLDYGYVKDAMTACLLGTDFQYNSINYLSEYYHDPLKNREKGHQQLADEVITFYMNLSQKYPLIKKGLVIYCDNSERSFISKLNERAVVKMGYYSWLSFKPCVKLKVVSRVDKKIMLMSENRLNINPDCVNVLRELRLSVWDDNKATLTPRDKDNHTLDALDYALTAWWKYLGSNQSNTNNFYLNSSKIVVN